MQFASPSFHTSTRFPRNRAKDIAGYFYFQGGISRGLWRLVYYRFTRASGWLIALTALFAAYGSNTLEIQAYVPVLYLFCIWFVAIVAAATSRPRVRLLARGPDRVRAGETLQIQLQMTQMRHWRQQLTVVANRLPPDLDPVAADGVMAPPLRFGETGRLSLALHCPARGLHLWRGFRVETDFPFGLIRAYRTYPMTQSVLVTPRFTPLTSLSVPTGRRYQPGGVAMASQLGDSLEFIGNRDYREGDNLRDMDWRATARLNRPIVREYREEYFLRVGVVLDTHLPHGSLHADSENFERAVSTAAAVSDYMARSDYIVDIFAAGPQLYHLTAGRSLAYIDQILEILACVEHREEEPFSDLEPEIVDSLAQITSVVCVLLDWDERRMRFVDQLLEYGSGVKVIVVRDTPCRLDPLSSGLPDIQVITREPFMAGAEAL